MVLHKEYRDTVIDIAKGIGIILVVIGHLLSEFPLPEVWGGVLHDWIYSFHMPLFFILAGFTLKETTVRKSMVRLYLPFVLWSIIATIYEIACSPSTFISIVVGNAVRTIVGYGIAPFWFLFALFIGQIIYLINNKLGIKKEFILCVCICLSTITAFVYQAMIEWMTGYIDIFVKTLCRQLVCVTFLYTGIIIKDKRHGIIKLKPAIRILVFIAALLVSISGSIINSGVNLHKFIIGNPILFFPTALAGAFVIWIISESIHRNRIFEVLGKNSMGIMCCHYKTLPLWTICFVVKERFISDNSVLSLTFSFLIIITCSLGISKLIEYFFPILIGKGRKYGRKSV